MQTFYTFAYPLLYTPTHTPHIYFLDLYYRLLDGLVPQVAMEFGYAWNSAQCGVSETLLHRFKVHYRLMVSQILCTCSISFQNALLCCFVCTVTRRLASHCMPGCNFPHALSNEVFYSFLQLAIWTYWHCHIISFIVMSLTLP